MTRQKRAWRVLDHARDFHRRLKEYYQNLSGQPQQPRVKLLLDYFSQHEANLEKIMASYEKDAPRVVLDTWFDCIYEECRIECFETSIDFPNLTVDQVMDLASRFNVCLETNYRHLIEGNEPEEVRQFFADLLNFEEGEKRKLVRNSQQIVDM